MSEIPNARGGMVGVGQMEGGGSRGVACGHEYLRWQRKGKNCHQWQGHYGCKTDWSPEDWWRGRGHWADGGGTTGVWHGATNDLRRQWG